MTERDLDRGRRIDPSVRHLIWGILAILVSGWLPVMVLLLPTVKDPPLQDYLPFFWIIGAFIFSSGVTLSTLGKTRTTRVLLLLLFPLVAMSGGCGIWFIIPLAEMPQWLMGVVVGLTFVGAVVWITRALELAEPLHYRVRPRETIA